MIVTILSEPTYGTIVQINNGFASSVNMVNVGTGVGIYRDMVGDIFNLKSLTAGTGIALVDNGDDIEISTDVGAMYQPLDDTLTALSGFNTNGLLTQTAPDTFTGRTLTAANTKIAVVNGSGVSGNPTIDVVEANFTGIPQSAVTGLTSSLNGKLSTSLATNNLFLGVGGVATALPPGSPNQALVVNGSNVPTWTTLGAGATDGGNALHVKEISFIWNMYAGGGGTSTTDITHGIADIYKIRDISIMIHNDAITLYNDLESIISGVPLAPQGGTSYFDGTIVRLVRLTGGIFDTVDYSSSIASRGVLTITYVS